MDPLSTVEMIGSFSATSPSAGRVGNPKGWFKVGVVEKITGSGRYVVSTEEGQKIEVRGPASLKPGDKVQIKLISNSPKTLSAQEIDGANVLPGDGIEWSAFIPLAFGGKDSAAKVEVYVERRRPEKQGKNEAAVYFVITVVTDTVGEVQWSIYLKGRQLSLQAFIKSTGSKREAVRTLVDQVEKTLKNKGFVFVSPTNILDRPFRVPIGFRLNLMG